MTDARTQVDLTTATTAGIRWISLARGGIEVLLLVSMVVLARLIPPEGFGMFAVVLIVQELARNIPSEGVGGAIVQRTSIERAHLEAGLTMTLTSGAVLTVVSLLAAWLLVAPLFGAETAWLVAMASPCFLIGAVLALPMAVMRRRLDFRRLSLLDVIQSVVRMTTTIVMAAAVGLDASALVLGLLAGAVTALVTALVMCPVPLPRWRPAAARELLPYGGPAALACVAWAGFRNGDYAIVGARLGTAEAGLYWRAYQLAVEYQRKISTIMTQISFPVLSRTASSAELNVLRRRMVQLLTVTLFPLLACLVVLAPVVVPWLFGPAWESAVLPTQILAGAGAATVVIDAIGSALMAQGRTRALLGYGVAHFAVYIGAVLVGTRYGVAGVAVAAVAVHAVFLVVAYQLLIRHSGARVSKLIWDDLGAAAIGSVALVAVTAPLEWTLSNAGAAVMVHLVIVGVAGAGAYLAVLRLAFPSAWQDLSALLRRVLPSVEPIRAVKRQAAVAIGRSSS